MKHLILYAEDDKDTAELYMDDFRANGYDVVWAKNGQEALDLYEKHTPDIILLDIEMPLMDGYDVAGKIRQEDLSTPIVFLTGFSKPADAVRGLDTGANDYIRKDNLEMNELLARIRAAIQRNPVTKGPVIYITSDTTLDMLNNQINCCGKITEISFREKELLHLFLMKKNIPQKRDGIISQLWDNNLNGESYLNKSISRLRNALSKDNRIQFVVKRGDSITLVVEAKL